MFESSINRYAFRIYLIFIISWFLRLPHRFPIFGLFRIDLIFVLLITLLILLETKKVSELNLLQLKEVTSGKWLIFISFYILITIPFVEWPGSVIKTGLETYLKAIIFYYFTVRLVTTISRLKTFLSVFIACQIFRVMEPLFLNLTTGYWGSFASMDNWEYLERLSGSPYDVVNPNGLAFIVDTIIPFIYFSGSLSRLNLALTSGLLPILLYALNLTGSRSGFLGLLTIVIGIIIKSRHRVALIVLIIGIGFFLFQSLSLSQKDRYLSIFFSNTANAATATDRIEGVLRDFRVAMHRPLFGHGITTSREANSNYDGRYILSHNLYTEVAQELGFFGLVVFLFYIRSIFQNSYVSMQFLRKCHYENRHLIAMNDALQVFLGMCTIFSFASYGLTSYEWYLFGGLSVVMRRLIENLASANPYL